MNVHYTDPKTRYIKFPFTNGDPNGASTGVHMQKNNGKMVPKNQNIVQGFYNFARNILKSFFSPSNFTNKNGFRILFYDQITEFMGREDVGKAKFQHSNIHSSHEFRNFIVKKIENCCVIDCLWMKRRKNPTKKETINIYMISWFELNEHEKLANENNSYSTTSHYDSILQGLVSVVMCMWHVYFEWFMMCVNNKNEWINISMFVRPISVFQCIWILVCSYMNLNMDRKMKCNAYR